MIEKHIVLDGVDPVIFFGVNNVNLQLLKALFPKLRIVARGSVIRILGDDNEIERFEDTVSKLEKYCIEYNTINEEILIDIINGKDPSGEKNGDVIVFSVTGRPIIARSDNQ